MGPTKTERIEIRVTPEEKALIEERAKKAGASLSEFLRDAVVVAPPPEADIAVDVEQLARQIYNTEGVPMSVARREAKRRQS